MRAIVRAAWSHGVWAIVIFIFPTCWHTQWSLVQSFASLHTRVIAIFQMQTFEISVYIASATRATTHGDTPPPPMSANRLEPKRAMSVDHGLEPRPEFHEETPQRRRKHRAKLGREKEKKSEILGGSGQASQSGEGGSRGGGFGGPAKGVRRRGVGGREYGRGGELSTKRALLRDLQIQVLRQN